MGKYDKDRFQKELAIRYCLARGLVPFVEVIVRSVADVSDSVEVLTDLDVLGILSTGDGRLHRVLFDCKTTGKISSVNRAFWAAGVKEYTKCDEAVVILKSRAVHNHRISALSVDVDLHDEESFKDLGRTYNAAFPASDCYQGEIARWNDVFECYQKNAWSECLFDLSRNVTPLSQAPWSTFRHVIADLRAERGKFDPSKPPHVALFLDILSSSFLLWSGMARDIRRFYDPAMGKEAFEKTLRYYLWGGKDAYSIRQQMKDRSGADQSGPVELPSWNSLVSFASLILAAPQSVIDCVFICRELSIRTASGSNEGYDKKLNSFLKGNPRVRQFTIGLAEYLVSAGTLPKEFATLVQDQLFKI